MAQSAVPDPSPCHREYGTAVFITLPGDRLIRITTALVLYVSLSAGSLAAPTFVGSAACADCHEAETILWRGSHHDLAMAEATPERVLGDFADAEFTAHGVTSRFYRRGEGYFVRTDGPDGALHDYPIRYTFGWYPLQQYLIELADGKLQALGIAWDSRPGEQGGQHWFHLYPNESMDHRHPLHWTSREQTWNYQCAECHSTDLRKNYDAGSDSYQTRWSEINVACEACHGPGSGHLSWARAAAQDASKRTDADKGLVINLADRDGASWLIDPQTGKPQRSLPRSQENEIQLCARCHSRRGQIWQEYEYGKPLTNTHRLAPLDTELYFPDGQIKDEVYVYGSFTQSRMYRAGVTCSNCHDPHSLKPRAEGNALCGSCHPPAQYDSSSHHHHPAGSTGADCIACHMPQRVYMVNDWRADHSLRVPRPDLSVKLGTPNACNGCHADKSSEWAAQVVTGWYPESNRRGPHFAETLQAAADADPEAAKQLLALAANRQQAGIVRATALDRLRDLASPQQLFTIQRLLADPDPLIRAAAVHYLQSADVRTQVDQGWPLLEDPDRSVRLEAARLLAPLLRQGVPAKLRQQLERAVAEYEQSQMVNAERPEAQLNLGLIKAAVGDAAGAEAAYHTAMRLEPGFAPAYVNLADLYRRQQRDAEGERLLRRGIETVTGKADLQHALGLLLVREKRLDEALPHLAEAATAAPDSARYAYVYALALQAAGDVPQALGVLKTANQRHPHDREILLTLAGMFRDSGDEPAAREYVGILLQQDPADPQALALQAQLAPP